MTNEPTWIQDGDAVFARVDNRRSPTALEPGVAASAINLAFDQGNPRPRLGVNLERWGMVGINLVADTWDVAVDGVEVAGLTVGRRYQFTAGNASYATSGVTYAFSVDPAPDGTRYEAGEIFTASTTSIWFWWSGLSAAGLPVTAVLLPVETPHGYGRFNDPNGQDTAVLLTDDVRDGSGEDGGRGRAWRILPGNTPQAIPLNGHDIWNTARLVQCYNGLVLLRQGDERHYFAAAAVDTTNHRIQLNCQPAWSDGEEIMLYADSAGAAIPGGPNLGAVYYVRTDSSNRASFYDTAAHATTLASTAGRISLSSAAGRFYIQRSALNPGSYGNGAPPLLLQPAPLYTAFENGFRGADPKVSITSVSANLFTAPNHRFVPGDQAVFAGVTWTAASGGYIAPQSDNTFLVYDTPENALADNGTTGLLAVTSVSSATVYKYGASGAPMPPGREGVYYKQRVVIVNGRNNVLISDVLDPLHYTLFAGITANLGENDLVTALVPLGDDTLLVIKENSVLAFTGLSGDSAGWALQEITREYGCTAPLTAIRMGKDCWFGARRGVASIALTEQGQNLGVALPVSDAIANRFKSVDWRYFTAACAAVWENRFFIALPFKEQDAAPVNNALLVYNTLNQGWEDLWQGDALSPVAFARLTIAGEERLTFVNADGNVCWFGDDCKDVDGDFDTELVTRGYFGGQRVMARKCEINVDTWNPCLTVLARTAGYNEETTLLDAKTYDATKYAVDGVADYNAATSTEEDFDRPHRQDYAPTAEELLVATLDALQNQTENLRMRLRDRSVQIVVRNTQGICRINSISVSGLPAEVRATVET